MHKQHNIDIVLETNDFLIINKPAGLVVHSDGKTEESTLVDWILKERPEIAGVGEPMTVNGKVIDRPGIVHRLDRETSGVMVIAKNQETFLFLKQAFQDRLVHKEYRAFVWGHFKEFSGWINTPIARSKTDFRKWVAGKGVRGEAREARTRWESWYSFEDELGNPFSFMALFPFTGRTHQLRVHMKFLQRPIVGDKLYASTKPQALGFSRVALHAHTIAFMDANNQKIKVSAPFPPDFEAALARYVKI